MTAKGARDVVHNENIRIYIFDDLFQHKNTISQPENIISGYGQIIIKYEILYFSPCLRLINFPGISWRQQYPNTAVSSRAL